MSRPIYVAASWRTPTQPAVVAALRASGLTVYDFRNPAPGDTGFGWREIHPYWQQWTPEQFVAALAHPIARRAFGQDMAAVARCCAIVLVQPSGRSAALEFGWAKGAGKPGAVLLAEGQEPELMLAMADLLTPSLDEIVEWARGHACPKARP